VQEFKGSKVGGNSRDSDVFYTCVFWV